METLPDFPLKPGDTIKRVDLHSSYGGSGQGGINPSRQSKNVFLFADPDTGLQHGYVDGWKNDGLFDYTGEGQRGDQVMKSGNAAILNHKLENRALRLFNGSSGTVRYVGEFEISVSQPFYLADAPETGDGPLRSVFVFRLAPIDVSPPANVTATPPAISQTVAIITIESNNIERFVMNPSAAPIEADRRESALVTAFCTFIEARGYKTSRHRIIPAGEVKPLFTDVFISDLNLLIEAKGTTERGSFRTALGQLADYRRFLDNPKRAILLPDRPREDLIRLAQAESVAIIYQVNGSFEASESFW